MTDAHKNTISVFSSKDDNLARNINFSKIFLTGTSKKAQILMIEVHLIDPTFQTAQPVATGCGIDSIAKKDLKLSRSSFNHINS